MLSPAIAERAPGPYLALSPGDAAEAGVGEGQEIDLALPGLPRGLAGVAAGIPGSLGLVAPAWVRLARRERREAA